MRSILLIFCGGLIAVGLVLGARATAPSRIASLAMTLSPDKAALGKTKIVGDVHVSGTMKVAWFKDPDGNIVSVAGN